MIVREVVSNLNISRIFTPKKVGGDDPIQLDKSCSGGWFNHLASIRRRKSSALVRPTNCAGLPLVEFTAGMNPGYLSI